ncbi:hypothetical protein SAMD00019534_110930 [Acytostelium subglobosum LB1]|uniref:hypothetical protein n=1 Tax=Acytostelium subglobosum LB1 TaxID=1410327 RepID=UPI000644EBAF|nr:hypothetical protein SAMD00019534_110930 [Acytostelium subglobosum LB1]GAM27917.1 hypothetical protein SAMD00019534_110930 [Acytostelium subglobosum LB1]|eukprot:XP_012749200.1 hypothetical protein SAMD00019534_110930 [Acytostelium subglobosum LB1]
MFAVVLVLMLATTTLTNAYNLNEHIEVFYVEAPLMKAQFGSLLGNLKAYHSGLYFYATESNENYTAQYVAYPQILNAIFPSVNQTDETISWGNLGIIEFDNEFNGTYWSTSQQYVMSITGAQFLSYICWMEGYNVTNYYYNLYDVRDYNTGELYMGSSTCDDFAWNSFTALYNLGGTFTLAPTSPPPRDFITLLVVQPPVIVNNINDPATWGQIMNFYEKMVFMPNETAVEIIQNLVNLFSGEFYYHYNNDYYNLTLISQQNTVPLSILYKPAPLPSGPRDPNSVRLPSNCATPSSYKKPGIGGGWIFIIIVCSASVVYIVAGLIFNVKQRGMPLNAQAMPNHDGWVEFGNLIKDGALFIKSKVTGTPSYSSL